MAEKLTPAQNRAVEWIKNGTAAQLGALGTEVGLMLGEMIVDLMDSQREAAHWKAAFETVRDEIKCLAAVAIKQQHAEKLVITKKELLELEGKDLHVGSPEPGVRVYEIRERRDSVAEEVSRILKPH